MQGLNSVADDGRKQAQPLVCRLIVLVLLHLGLLVVLAIIIGGERPSVNAARSWAREACAAAMLLLPAPGLLALQVQPCRRRTRRGARADAGQ